jgi:hypothetical protein
MIIVSGYPRSGTSLMMIVLRNLGFKISGRKNPAKRKGQSKKIEQHVGNLNRDGYWEIPKITMRGMTAADRKSINSDVVKLTTWAILYSCIKMSDKIILCIRDPREIIVSHRATLRDFTDEQVYEEHNLHTRMLIARFSPIDWSRTHVVDYADILREPNAEINRLADFLGTKPTKCAVSAVKPNYKTANLDIHKDEEADKLYQQLRKKANEIQKA